MDLPDLRFNVVDDTAMKVAMSVINQARMKYGNRMNLFEIAGSHEVGTQMFINLSSLQPPLAINSEILIRKAIENVWRLTNTFAYHVKYLGTTKNECAQFYYYEAIFSQPTVECPIPQTTASVFFKIEDQLVDPPAIKPAPSVIFRVEGHHKSQDIRYVKVIPEWISEVLMMKIKLYSGIERINIF